MHRITLGKTGLEINRVGFGGIPILLIPDLIKENIAWVDEYLEK